MKHNSIRAKLEQKEANLGKKSATERQQFNNNPPAGVKERQEFFNSAKAKRKSFFSNLQQQMQKMDQKERLAVEETLNTMKWKKVYSGEKGSLFFNKQFPGINLFVSQDQFALYGKEAKGWPLFTGEAPLLGPLGLEEMEAQLTSFKG